MKEKLATIITINNLIILHQTLNFDKINGIVLNIRKEVIMSFIKARLNRDNFWNLMFWLEMTVGLTSAVLLSLAEYNKLAFIGFWLTILGVPYIIQKACRVSFNEEKNFLNSKGEILNEKIPNSFAVIASTAAGVALSGLVMDSYFKNTNLLIAISIIIALLFLIPTLYFIYKNCPIAILFNKNAFKTLSPEQLAAINQSPSIAEQRNSPFYSDSPFHYTHYRKHDR